jgi:hypothetical protein
MIKIETLPEIGKGKPFIVEFLGPFLFQGGPVEMADNGG